MLIVIWEMKHGKWPNCKLKSLIKVTWKTMGYILLAEGGSVFNLKMVMHGFNSGQLDKESKHFYRERKNRND